MGKGGGAHRLDGLGVGECVPLVEDGRAEVEVLDALLVPAEQLVVSEAVPTHHYELQGARLEVRVRRVHDDHLVPHRIVRVALQKK